MHEGLLGARDIPDCWNFIGVTVPEVREIINLAPDSARVAIAGLSVHCPKVQVLNGRQAR
jgi:hypothetical protein